MTTEPQLEYDGHIPSWDLADRLTKSLRESVHTVQSIADQLEVTRDTVSRWLHGRTKPNRMALYSWAVLTGTDLEWLATGHDWRDAERAAGRDWRTGVKLPRLDSNQQPSGYLSLLVSEPLAKVVRLDERRAS